MRVVGSTEGKKYPKVPSGEYKAVVFKWEKDIQKMPDAIRFSFKIIDGPYKDGFANMTSWPEWEKDKNGVKKNMKVIQGSPLERLCRAFSKNKTEIDIDLDSLLGEECMVRVELQPSKKDPEVAYSNVVDVVRLGEKFGEKAKPEAPVKHDAEEDTTPPSTDNDF